MELITSNGWTSREDDVETLYQYDEEKITELLVGHSVKKVAEDHLLLDNGTLLKFEGNDGGCACNAGCYSLEHLQDVDNIITNVEFEVKDNDQWGEDKTYKIFVLADNEKINLATFDGTDGNGYYGTGYHIFVRVAK